MMAISNRSPSIAATVRLMPSTAIDPWATTYLASAIGISISSRQSSPPAIFWRRSSLPTPSTWPCTRCPPRRSWARAGSSRFTGDSLLRRPSEVRLRVSWARSAENCSLPTSTAVRHTPLTATLSPALSSEVSCARTVIRVSVSSVCFLAGKRRSSTILPTSAISPVNIYLWSVIFLGRHCRSGGIGIAQVTLHRKIFAKAMQRDVPDHRGLADSAEPDAGGKGYRSGSRQNLRRVIQKDFVDNAGSQGSPVHQRPSLNEQAGDLHLAQAGGDLPQVGPAIGRSQRRLLHPDVEALELLPLLFFGKGAEYHQVFCRRFHQARFHWQAQTRIQDHAQQRTAARTAGAIGE